MASSKRTRTKKHAKKTSLTGKFSARSGKPSAKKQTASKKKLPRKVMVIIHGGGDIPENYYKDLVNGVQAILGKPFPFLSAYYSDVITGRVPGVTSVVALEESPQVKQFKAEYEKKLREKHAKNQEEKRELGATSFLNLPIDPAIKDTVNEVVQYLFNESAATRVRERLCEMLDQAAKKYDEIVLVSHSLGTLVSFDVLKEIANRYNISYWFTLGCPLVKLVKLHCRDAQLGNITASHVARWYNVYDTNDFVGDAISATYHTPDFRVHDIFVQVADSMPAAHDYLLNKETYQLVADAMR